VDIVLRPEDVELSAPSDDRPRGTVVSAIFKGVHYEMRIACGENLIVSHSTRHVAPGTEVSLDVTPENIQVMIPSDTTPALIAAKKAQRVRLEVGR